MGGERSKRSDRWLVDTIETADRVDGSSPVDRNPFVNLIDIWARLPVLPISEEHLSRSDARTMAALKGGVVAATLGVITYTLYNLPQVELAVQHLLGR